MPRTFSCSSTGVHPCFSPFHEVVYHGWPGSCHVVNYVSEAVAIRIGHTFHIVFLEFRVDSAYEFSELYLPRMSTAIITSQEGVLTMTQVSLLTPLLPFSAKKSNHHWVYLSFQPPSMSSSWSPSVERTCAKAPP